MDCQEPDNSAHLLFCRRAGALRTGFVLKGETVSINGRHEKITWYIGANTCFYENGEVMSIDVKHRRNTDGSFIFYTCRDKTV